MRAVVPLPGDERRTRPINYQVLHALYQGTRLDELDGADMVVLLHRGRAEWSVDVMMFITDRSRG